MPKESAKRKVQSVKLENKVQEAKEVKVNSVSQIIVGRVVSAKLPQTATVIVEGEKIHPLYLKKFKRSKKYLAENKTGAILGDVVEMIKIKPLSKNKHWQILKVVGKDIEAVVSQELKAEAAEAIAEVMPEEEIKDQNSKVKTEKQDLTEGGHAGLSGSKPEIKEKAKSRKSK